MTYDNVTAYRVRRAVKEEKKVVKVARAAREVFAQVDSDSRSSLEGVRVRALREEVVKGMEVEMEVEMEVVEGMEAVMETVGVAA